jgi:uncharacterized protein (DUF433 family)
MLGKPVITGTRITVELILEKLGAGESVEEILSAHPRLTREGIDAAIAFAGAFPNACDLRRRYRSVQPAPGRQSPGPFRA